MENTRAFAWLEKLLCQEMAAIGHSYRIFCLNALHPAFKYWFFKAPIGFNYQKFADLRIVSGAMAFFRPFISLGVKILGVLNVEGVNIFMK